MAKLTQAQKEAYREAKAGFCFSDGTKARVFFSRDAGMMFAALPTPSERKHGQVIFDVAVALCHPNDEFKKKIGLAELFNSFEEGRTTRMRITDMYDFAERMFDYMGFDEMQLN